MNSVEVAVVCTGLEYAFGSTLAVDGLDLSVVAGALHHLDFGDQQRVLSQDVPAGIEGLVEDGDLALILAVVEDHERHLPAPRRLRAQLRDDAGDADARRRRPQQAQRLLNELLQLHGVSVIRMA